MAKECCEQALAISRESKHERGQAINLSNLGTVYQHHGDYKTAYELHQKALNIKIKTDYKEELPVEYLHLGRCCERFGKYAKATEFWHQGIDIQHSEP